VLLAQLDNQNLALEPTRKVRSAGEREWPDRGHPRPARIGAAANRATKARNATDEDRFELDDRAFGKGFDPYNRS